VPVEQLRNILLIALVAVSFLLFQAWLKDYGPKPSPPAAEGVEPAPTPRAGMAPTPPGATTPDVPTAPPPVAGAAPAPTPARPAVSAQTPSPGDEVVVVRTDVLRAEIDPRGGDLRRLELLAYPMLIDRPEEPLALLERTPENTFIAQSGLLGGTPDAPAPNHHARFVPERNTYELARGEDSLTVRLVWTGADGTSVSKVYTFTRDSYVIGLQHEVQNAGNAPWPVRMYGQFHRSEVVRTGGLFGTYTYTGVVLYGPDKPYEKITFDDMENADVDRTVRGGWAAMIQHYFAGAWLPAAADDNHFYSKALEGRRFVLGVLSATRTVAPGESDTIPMRIYAGPKIQERMAQAAEHLDRTVDYGWLWLISQPLFWLMTAIHGVVGNWGWSIILLTLTIKLAFFHLSATSYKSMAKMRKLQPRLVQLRERHGDDRQRLNQAMMQLYKEERINPLGGCLPIVVQIPVFIALYWVLLESVELRQASFIFWLDDLSVHDPYFVLPIMMGVTMLLQQRLNPAPPDPMQAKVMMALPFVFTFLFLFFPSGLVLYWFVNNCLSIAQQWVITRKIVGTT
jgi:YidC/Oxa1 family membrane protein insertase